jgi:hypothetical protein
MVPETVKDFFSRRLCVLLNHATLCNVYRENTFILSVKTTAFGGDS